MLWLPLFFAGPFGLFWSLDESRPMWTRFIGLGIFLAFLVMMEVSWLRQHLPRLAWVVYDLEEIDGPCPPKHHQ